MKKRTWAVPLVAAMLLVGIGWWGRTTVRRQLEKTLADKLNSNLRLSVSALELWLESQKSVAATWAQNPEIRQALIEQNRLTIDPDVTAEQLLKSSATQLLRQRLGPICRQYGYIGFVAINRQGTNITALLDEPIGQRSLVELSDFVPHALEGETVVSRPFTAEVLLPDENGDFQPNHPTMFAAAPVYDEEGNVFAVLSFRIRPEADFTRVLALARIGETGDPYAFDEEGLLLTASRFKNGLREIGLLARDASSQSILNLHVRDPGGDLTEGYKPHIARGEQPLTRMAAAAVRGESGHDIAGYRDYRGVPVVGAWTWLPKYGFGVTSEVDYSEAFAPVHSLERIFAVIFSMLALGFAVAVVLEQKNQNAAKVLQKSRERFDLAVSGSNAGLWDKDFVKRTVWYSPRYKEMLGYGDDEFENTLDQWVLHLHPEDHDDAIATFEGQLKRGLDYEDTYRLKMKNGEYGWFRATGKSQCNASGRVTRAAGSIVDISEQMQIEVELRTHAQQLEETQCTLEEQASELEAQKAELETASNLNEREQWVKTGIATISDAMRGDQTIDELGRNIVSTLAKYVEVQTGIIYLANGEEKYRLTAGYAFGSPDEIGTLLDPGEGITGQAIIENKITKLNDVPDGYLSFGSGLGQCRLSHFLVIPIGLEGEMLGAIELASLNEISNLQMKLIEQCIEPIAIGIKTGQSRRRTETLFTEAQAQSEELQATNDELLATNEELEAVSQELENQQNELEQKNRDMEITKLKLESNTQELERSSQYKSDFLANMSHEIRTPMTAILGFSDILENQISEPENLESVRTIRQNCEYLLGIIDDILDISKIESGKLEVDRQICSPCQIIADVLSLMRQRADTRGIKLVVKYDGPMPKTIETDPTRLRQILINLLGNAIKFTETGEVRMAVRLLHEREDNPQLQFRIIDTGIGMTREQLAKIFRPFTQADSSTTRQFGGTGLGLSISKQMAEMLGGYVIAESVHGEGSTFTMTVATGSLDKVEMIQHPAEATLVRKKEKPSDRELPTLDCRILLAEDGVDNQRLLTLILSQAGAVVTLVDNGKSAVELAMSNQADGKPFDVILMDMQMPVMDGYEATQELRRQGYQGSIIAVTAHAMLGDRQKCLQAGCSDYTTKPIDRARLLQLIADHCLPASTETRTETTASL